MKSMYDAAVPQHGMPPFDVVAGYIGSPGATPHVWSVADWDSQTARYRLPIYVPSWFRTGVWDAAGDAVEAVKALHALGVPQHVTVAIDFETEINPSYVTSFVNALNSAGWFTVLYGSTGTPQNPTVFANPPGSVGYWPADPNGTPHLFAHANVVGTQYGQVQGNGHDYDLNVLLDSVPLWDTTSGGSTVSLTIPPSIAVRWPDQAAAFPPGAVYDDAVATIWADAGAREAADKANELVTHVLNMQDDMVVIKNLIQTLQGQVANMPTGGVSADAIAAAVVTRMGTDLQHG
jgi:hypothetical protein